MTRPRRQPITRQGAAPAAETRQIALVIWTRPYDSLSLLELLVRSDFTAVERGSFSDGLRVVDKLHPSLVVVVCDPAVPSDVESLETVARSTKAFILVIAPTYQTTAVALRAGADACLSDLDGSDAIEAQIEAFRRRPGTRRRRPPGSQTSGGDIRLDVNARRIETPRGRAQLTDTEMAILLCLGQHPGEVVTTMELLHAVTGRVGTELEAQHTIKVYVRRLRVKLEQVGLDPNAVANIRGRGYLLDVRAQLE